MRLGGAVVIFVWGVQYSKNAIIMRFMLYSLTNYIKWQKPIIAKPT